MLLQAATIVAYPLNANNQHVLVPVQYYRILNPSWNLYSLALPSQITPRDCGFQFLSELYQRLQKNVLRVVLREVGTPSDSRA